MDHNSFDNFEEDEENDSSFVKIKIEEGEYESKACYFIQV